MKTRALHTLFVLVMTLCLSAPNAASAADFESRVQSAVGVVLPSTVSVQTGNSISGGFGSGFIVNKDKGYAITNYHVVVGNKDVKITLQDSTSLKAKVVFFNSKTDLALLKIDEADKLPKALKLELNKQPKLGEFAIASGSPGGYQFSVTVGMVSALNRTLLDKNADVKFIQVDTPMYRGSSGGPLVNLSGDVIGVSSRGGASGAAAFAVPASLVKELIDGYESKAAGEPDKPKEMSFGYLGAKLQPLVKDFKDYFKFEADGGVLVAYVYPGSAAEKAGLKSGDILTKAGSLDLSAGNASELVLVENQLKGLGPGKHQLSLWRDKKLQTLEASFKETPACEAKSIEGDRATLVNHTNNKCYLVPEGEFVEFTRYWNAAGISKSVQPQKGDILVTLNGSSKELSKRVESALKNENKSLALVFRGGRPTLSLIGQLKKE